MTSGRHQFGFSLLELLLVLVVVGLIVTVAGLSISSGSRPYTLDGAVSNFSNRVEYAMDEAQLAGVDMGLLLEVSSKAGEPLYSYIWLQRQGLEWGRVQRDQDVFARREFPLGIDIELELEDVVLDLFGQAERDTVTPQIIFYSSGETTPGLMRWIDRGIDGTNSGDILWELEWDLIAQMDLRRRGEANEEG